MRGEIANSFPWNPTPDGKPSLTPIQNAVFQYIQSQKEISSLREALKMAREALEAADCTCVLGKSLYTMKPEGHSDECAFRASKKAIAEIEKVMGS